MKTNEDSLAQRVESSYRQLSSVASDLNLVSDELGKSISELDSALKRLNLGITVWVAIRNGEYELDYWSEDLGYAKVDGKWGIALRTVSGNHNFPDQDTIEQWLFNDAPRLLRLSAIGTIPKLLEKLSQEATDTAKKIRGRLTETQHVAAAVRKAAQEPHKLPLRATTATTNKESK